MNRFDRLTGASDLTGGFVDTDWWTGFEDVGLVDIFIAGAGC